MKLITPDEGWAATGSHVFWTTDNGQHWREITPRTNREAHVASVFFMNASTGWVLLSSAGDQAEEPRLDLASTSTNGASWSITHLKVPNLDSGSTTLSGQGRLDFVDSMHGWLNLDVASSANFQLGTLLMTADGGKTWNWVPESPGVSGSIRFATLKDGWLAGGPGHEKLYVTHDGSKSWQQVSINGPKEAGSATLPTFDVPPIFEDDTRGFLPVTFSGTGNASSTLVLFTSHDLGRTWKPDRVLSNLKETSPGQVFPSTVADSVWILASVSGHAPALTTVPSGGTLRGPSIDASAPESSFLQLSFATGNQGWVLTEGKLQSTTDGGTTWKDITPLPAQAPPVVANPIKGEASTNLDEPFRFRLEPSFTAGTSSHVGFHKCNAANTGDMGTWWSTSPFFDVGIYIGGASRTCSNSQLNSNWVTTVENQGWGLMPLWAGPQAPCACRPGSPTCTPFPHVFSSTPQTAQSQGVAEASSSAAAASALGLSGTAIYYDMEQYDSSTCGAAVSAFVNGWVSQLHTSGYTAGVYGAAADAQSDWTVSPLPDDVWIAQTPLSGKPPRIAIWGLTGLSDTQWATGSGSRIHQFLGNYSQTWGGVAFSVDTNIEHATIAANNGAKTGSYSYTSIDYPGATGTWAAGINDISGTGLINTTSQTGTIVGYYNDSSGHTHGFQDANGTLTSIDYPGAPDTLALGINSSGQIVGGWCDTAGFCHGFLLSAGTFSRMDYPGSTFTQSNGINDAGQIVGEYHNSTGFDHGFLRYQGQTYSIDAPGATFGTHANAINGDASIAGTFFSPDTSFVEYAFPPTWSGTFTSFSYGGGATDGNGIDNDNDLAGAATVGGFLLTGNLVVTTFQYPGATSTDNLGVNDFGQIVGWYQDSSGTFHGFLAAPQ